MGIFFTSSSLLPKLCFSISKPSKVNRFFSESISKMGFNTVKELLYIVTMAPSCGNRTFWCRDEGTTSVSWIHGLPRSKLKHNAMFRTLNSTFLITGPIVNSSITISKTSLYYCHMPSHAEQLAKSLQYLGPSNLQSLKGTHLRHFHRQLGPLESFCLWHLQ